VTTNSIDDASPSTTTSTPFVDSTNSTGGIIVFDEKKPAAAAVLEEGGTRPQSASSPRKIRFKVPLALPHLPKRSRLRALFTPTRRIGPAPSYGRSFVNMFKFSPLNVLLVFLPISWVLHFTHQSNTLIFATSALAVLPLAALLGFGTEQVAVRTSSAVAALLNASLGNLTELIIAGICLSRCQLALVQSTLLGGLLSNLLLVLGSAFIVGGFRYPQLSFRPAAAQLNASLLTVGVISMIIPTAFVSVRSSLMECTLTPPTSIFFLVDTFQMDRSKVQCC
jgi:Ca2+:H+ antiporter